MTLLASPLESIESAVIWLLVVFSVATWGLALLKGVQFARLKAQDRKFHKQFWAASSLDSAAELAETQPGAAARVAQAGYAAIQVGEAPQATDLSQAINHQDRLERALRQQIVRERRSLETGLAVVASIGSTSPFIGLFGTVWGIMEALKGISAAGSASLETVAGPIGAALVATGVGIAVAVPAVLVYNYFLRRLKLTAADLDDFAHDFYSLAQKNSFRVLLHPTLSIWLAGVLIDRWLSVLLVISWGLSLVFGGLLVRALARRTDLRMDYRAAGAAAYLGLGAVLGGLAVRMLLDGRK